MLNKRTVTTSAAQPPLTDATTQQHAADAKKAPQTRVDARRAGEATSHDTHNAAQRAELIATILTYDKEIFELKRQHELSMLRVEQHQRRMLNDQEDRGMYYEQNSNVVTFDTVSSGLYSQRSGFYHTMSVERLRNFKLLLIVLTTITTCAYLYYRYMINPDYMYTKVPIRLAGSQVHALREQCYAQQTQRQANKDVAV